MASGSTISTDDVLYSTRSCRRCGTPMSATVDQRDRRVWRCASCGGTRH